MTKLSDPKVQVATTIARQLGPMTFMMLGVDQKSLLKDKLGGLSIRIKARNQKKVKYINIVLNAMDTYDMTFINSDYEVVEQYDGVYVDQLHDLIERATGLYARM
jgi:hypothetical protein